MVKKLKRLSLQSPATPSVEQTGAFGVELDKCVPSANNEVSLQELSVRFRAFSFRASFRFQNDFHLTFFLTEICWGSLGLIGHHSFSGYSRDWQTFGSIVLKLEFQFSVPTTYQWQPECVIVKRL